MNNGYFCLQFAMITKELNQLKKNVFILNNEGAIESFAKHPEFESYSIDINDETTYDFILSQIKIKNVKKIFIHYFSPFYFKFLETIPKDINVIVVFFGGEFFYSPFMVKKIHQKLTRTVYKESYTSSPSRATPVTLKNLYYKLIGKKKIAKELNINYKTAWSRVNYIAHWNKFDIELVKKELNINPQIIDFNFIYFDATKYNSLNNGLDHNRIMIGNSASFSNNHFDIFELFKQKNIKTKNIEICIPLSYGEMPDCIKKIRAKAEEVFDKIKYLDNFMSEDGFLKVLDECKVGVFNANMQHAGGTSISMLLLGKKVYLNKMSTLYKFFENINVKIYNIDSINNIKDLMSPISIEDAKNNRTILIEHFGKSKVLNRYSHLLTF
jgi:hypothetical protein